MEYEDLLSEAYENIVPVEPCERFEVVKVRGHHEGSRTVITNFLQISSCMRRSPSHLMKFLSRELACLAEISGERLILSRKLPSGLINDKIDKYVRRFVTCKKCGKPDTEILSENGGILLHCLACGAKYLADI